MTHTSDPVPYLLFDSAVDGPGGSYTEPAVADRPVVVAHSLMALLGGTGSRLTSAWCWGPEWEPLHFSHPAASVWRSWVPLASLAISVFTDAVPALALTSPAVCG